MSRADAMALAAQGWRVFPCQEKRPLTPSGFRDASTTVGTWPEGAQIAIAIPEGMLVVDVDDPNAPLPGALPDTLTASTKRGRHHYYRTNGTPTATLIQRKLAPGVDTRVGGKGYVIAPPTPGYAWQNALPIADAPPWLLEALAAPPEPAIAPQAWPTPSTDALAHARKWLATSTPSVQGQDGSGSLMRAAGVFVRGFALGPEIGLHLLREYNERAQPPWDEYDLARAVQSAATSSREPSLGSMLPDVDLLAALRAPPPQAETLEIGDIFMPLPTVAYLVHEIGIAPGAPTMIAGYGYSGKTVAVQQLALDLAREDHEGAWMMKRPVWSKFPGVKRARVLHVDYEQGRSLTCRRYQRLALGAGIDAKALDGWLRLITLPGWYTNTAAGYDALEKASEGFDLVIVDSFRASNPGTDENSSDAREPLDALNRLSEKHGWASIVIHHARKPSHDKPGGTKMAIRGSGALFDGCASVLVFDGVKDGPKRVVHEKERHSGVTIDDFDLVIEDHGGGFRIRAADVAPVSLDQAAKDQIEGDIAKALAYLETHGFYTNRNELQAAMNVSTTRVGAAVGAMLTRGLLVKEPGKGGRTVLAKGKKT